MKLYNTYGKIINLIITFVIVSAITIIIKNYFKPFFIVLALIFVTNPIYKLILKSNVPKSLSAILSIISRFDLLSDNLICWQIIVEYNTFEFNFCH